MDEPVKSLDDQFWSDRYRHAQTGWDIGYPSTPLKEYIDQLADKSIRILIPGCGNAYEAEYLIQQGFTHLTLLDISVELVNRLKARFKNDHVQIIHEDFFVHRATYDLILEQTFFCALEPSLRIKYVDKSSELLDKGGKLVGVLFNRQFEENPPFGGDTEEYKKLFREKFKIRKMESCYNSIPPRKGTELFIILQN